MPSNLSPLVFVSSDLQPFHARVLQRILRGGRNIGLTAGAAVRGCALGVNFRVLNAGTGRLHVLQRNCLAVYALCLHTSQPFIPCGLLLTLLNELPRTLTSLLAQCDIDPEPCRQLNETPAEHDAVLKIAARAVRVRNTPGSPEHASLLKQESVAGKCEQEYEAHGCLGAPVLVEDLLR